ncbi:MULTISPECIES: hypothetical protein [Rhizobium]|uniref:hypothetical protein n=1 Tax=Rhizobium TaxID=379 RepID=UPI001B32E218|nr:MULTISPECIES: hypothetical protein [Rhizobium]MBX4911679.1 hypothetical protein [Rhizobium bangladeshense]MBX5254462.1 hypothetical protein [Rhizobium sp. NLR4b]MBX5260647.1 hypothetical protein [Rhizobium sp. NLR16b]MBX5266732.1 hypothetical protein [Rhizobium sp. NLR16a]MBX5297139.1 hypothetical protein [Rhizobium sp. NLR15a]
MNEEERIWGDLTLREIEEIIQRCYRYSGFVYEGFPDLYVQQFFITKSVDTDGYPFEIDITVYKRGPSGNFGAESPWRVGIHYESVQGDDFDFIERHARSTTTAYKMGRPGTPEEVKFKLKRCNYPLASSKVSEEAYRELLALNDHYKRADEATSSLGAWVDSGFNMGVYCRGCSTRRQLDQAALEQLRGIGHSLESLKNRLVCHSCGKKNAFTYPTR